jgi:hypothetical protein
MSRVTRFTALLAVAAATVLGSAATASADSWAQGAAIGSPGVLSGNVIQAPIDVPINACGNTVNVLGLLNPAIGNTCANGFGHKDHDHGSRGDDHRSWNHDHHNCGGDHHFGDHDDWS